MVANFFSVDFQTLDGDERALLEQMARDGARRRKELAQAIRRTEETVEPLLYGLRMMGYLTTAENGTYRIGNWFFERWLRRVTTSAGVRPA